MSFPLFTRGIEFIRRYWRGYWGLWVLFGSFTIFYFSRDGIHEGIELVVLAATILLSGLWFLGLMADLLRSRRSTARGVPLPAPSRQRCVAGALLWSASLIVGLYTFTLFTVILMTAFALIFTLIDFVVRLLVAQTTPER